MQCDAVRWDAIMESAVLCTVWVGMQRCRCREIGVVGAQRVGEYLCALSLVEAVRCLPS